MEFVQAFTTYFLAFAVFAAVSQVLISYSLQVIAEKNELPEFASFIAWIPVLNIYPAIKVGGGDFKRLLLGTIAAVVGFAVVAGGAAAAGHGGIGTGIASGVLGLVILIYFARICMGTAERRGLSKWLGLLFFVPLANLFIYPYIAFHDGFQGPNKFGLVLGLLIAFGPLPGQIKMMDTIAQQAQQVADTGLGDEVGGFEQAMAGLGPMMEISAQLAMVGGMDPADPEQLDTMNSVLTDVQNKLAENADAIGADAYAELNELYTAQARRVGGAPSEPMERMESAANGNAFAAAQPQALAAAPAAPLTSGIPRNGEEGFAVPDSPECPPGTSQRSSDSAKGARQWCEKVGADAGIKHGWNTEYHANGAIAAVGEYRDGLRVGVWTRYFDNGVKRVQAEFSDGLQDGVLISWGPDGTLIYEKYFSQGAPTSRPASR